MKIKCSSNIKMRNLQNVAIYWLNVALYELRRVAANDVCSKQWNWKGK